MSISQSSSPSTNPVPILVGLVGLFGEDSPKASRMGTSVVATCAP